MWIKINGDRNYYDPYLLNLETGARIYIQVEDNDDPDLITYKIYYDMKDSEEVYILKSIEVNRWDDEDDGVNMAYSMPLSYTIDKIFEDIKKGEPFEI